MRLKDKLIEPLPVSVQIQHTTNNIFYLFYPEQSIRQFVQIVADGDNLHEMSNTCWGKIKHLNMSSADFFTKVLCVNSFTAIGGNNRLLQTT